MATNQLPDEKQRVAPTGKPLQRISWGAKVADEYEWFKKNIDYRISLSQFNAGRDVNSKKKDLGLLYAVYNNQFPLEWFSHFTDPLSAEDPNHKKFPAKIRPTSMLRTNIDLLLGEYPKRPFVYQVVNMGEDAYNSYLDGLNNALNQNLQEHFLAVAQQKMAEAGHDVEQIPQDQEIPMPEEIKDRFTSNYKDNLARRGQKWMKRAIREYNIRQKQLKMFKDWLIAGGAFSYKNIENGNLIYERVSRMELDFDKSVGVDFVEDGEWAVRRVLRTGSDIVDRHYDELKNEDHTKIETRMQWSSPFAMYDYLQGTTSQDRFSGHIPVYHIVWKGKKEIIYATYTDPFTGETEEMILDEDTPIDDTLKVTSRKWVNEVYEGTRIGDDIYCMMRAIPVQRNEMNNYSSCKLPYNGKNYSDTHAENISVLEMGLPYAIMYMLTNFTLEKTIAKNKGKIALIDQNSIPKNNNWTEEKFFYYADALGYMLVNRNQVGVDKSFNQYQTLDMGLFDQIKELIGLRDSFKNEWDSLLGITPQRKAQVDTSAGLGTTQEAIFRSSLMTDMIFMMFEELTEKDLQGLLDYSRFVNVDGVRGIYNQDDYDRELLEIDPNSYCSAELGLFVSSASEEQNILNSYKAQVPNMIQNAAKPSTILEIQHSNNVAELLGKLKRIEEIEAQQAQAQQGSEQEHEAAIEQLKEKFLQIASDLKINEINAEWDRKDENEMIKGEYSLFGFGGDGDNNDNGVPDAVEIGKRVVAQQKILADARNTDKEIAHRDRIHKDNMKLENQKMNLDKQQMAHDQKMAVKQQAADEKIQKLKIKEARAKRVSSSK